MFKFINKSKSADKFLSLGQELYTSIKQELGFEKDPTVTLVDDDENMKDSLGKTAYYDPSSHGIVLYCSGRHVKDILRSFSHELVHHSQNCNGKFSGQTETPDGYAQNDDFLREMEKEAYLKGNMQFRDWEDGHKMNESLWGGTRNGISVTNNASQHWDVLKNMIQKEYGVSAEELFSKNPESVIEFDTDEDVIAMSDLPNTLKKILIRTIQKQEIKMKDNRDEYDKQLSENSKNKTVRAIDGDDIEAVRHKRSYSARKVSERLGWKNPNLNECNDGGNMEEGNPNLGLWDSGIEEQEESQPASKVAKIKSNKEWNEYIVKFYKDGQYLENADYHCDDKEEAMETKVQWENS